MKTKAICYTLFFILAMLFIWGTAILWHFYDKSWWNAAGFFTLLITVIALYYMVISYGDRKGWK